MQDTSSVPSRVESNLSSKSSKLEAFIQSHMKNGKIQTKNETTNDSDSGYELVVKKIKLLIGIL